MMKTKPNGTVAGTGSGTTVTLSVPEALYHQSLDAYLEGLRDGMAVVIEQVRIRMLSSRALMQTQSNPQPQPVTPAAPVAAAEGVVTNGHV